MNQDFLWGAATSSFQIEGNISNDFTEWEKIDFFKQEGKNPLYENGSNHWKTWEEDFLILKELGINSYRFSIEWARIFPEYGKLDLSALEQYEKMIDRLVEYNIKPMITLHHFSNPIWLHEITPWDNEKVIDSFFEFAKIIIDKFNKKVNLWVTFNEPVVWALAAYAVGKFPPGKKKFALTFPVLRNILNAHRKVYDYIKSINKELKVGIAKHFVVFKEANIFSLIGKGIVNRMDAYFNRMFLEAFQKNELKFSFPPFLSFNEKIQLDDKIDFWGINYYYRMHVKFKFNVHQPVVVYFKTKDTDMGWEVYPKGLKKIIKLVEKYGKDIYITENGIATEDEQKRVEFISNHLEVLKKLLKKNNKIKGYYYWSLLDNYEWLEGKDKRFGLVNIDYNKNFKRRVKFGARYYSDVISKVTKMK